VFFGESFLWKQKKIQHQNSVVGICLKKILLSLKVGSEEYFVNRKSRMKEEN
jgi:hypothetical protein